MQLIPRDNQFYDLFSQVASRMSGSATLLHELFKDPRKLEQNVTQIKTLEHEAGPQIARAACGTTRPRK